MALWLRDGEDEDAWTAAAAGAIAGVLALSGAGLAYPIRSELRGEGVGVERIGIFSTGASRERVTQWVPGRTLRFSVITQPPAMEEMSPYRRVHAPHVAGAAALLLAAEAVETTRRRSEPVVPAAHQALRDALGATQMRFQLTVQETHIERCVVNHQLRTFHVIEKLVDDLGNTRLVGKKFIGDAMHVDGAWIDFAIRIDIPARVIAGQSTTHEFNATDLDNAVAVLRLQPGGFRIQYDLAHVQSRFRVTSR